MGNSFSTSFCVADFKWHFVAVGLYAKSVQLALDKTPFNSNLKKKHGVYEDREVLKSTQTGMTKFL